MDGLHFRLATNGRGGRGWYRWLVVGLGASLMMVGAGCTVTTDSRASQSEASDAGATMAVVADVAQAVGVVVAGLGLWFIVVQVLDTRRSQRFEWAPYVRVDVIPSDRHEDDMALGPAYFRDAQRVQVLPAEQRRSGTVGFSAWFRNYQTHDLGTAISPLAVFFLKGNDEQGQQHEASTEIQIPYLAHGKPVEVELFRVPRSWDAEIALVKLTYLDVRGKAVLRATNESDVMFGRLVCTYVSGRFEYLPEAIIPPPSLWSRIRNRVYH